MPAAATASEGEAHGPPPAASRRDPLDPAARSRLMARIRSRDTGPELAVRSALHAAGLRFRLHARGLPGTPDLVFPGRRTVVFVDGCFWHGHGCCRVPDSDFWRAKIAGTRARDRRVRRLLRAGGWSVLTVRECRLHADTLRVIRRLVGPVAGPGPGAPPRPPAP